MRDAIDLSTVTILNSPDVRAWPITTDIARVDCTPDNTRFTFAKQTGPDAWPPQAFGDPKDGGNCQYTVWLFLQLAGQWYGAAFIQMWQGRDGVGDPISDYVNNWLLAGRGWEPMVGHAIAVGETIGFMVSAGNARTNGASSVHERSNVVTIQAPAGDVGRFTFPITDDNGNHDGGGTTVDVTEQDLIDLAHALLDVGHAFIAALDRNTAELAKIAGGGVKVHL